MVGWVGVLPQFSTRPTQGKNHPVEGIFPQPNDCTTRESDPPHQGWMRDVLTSTALLASLCFIAMVGGRCVTCNDLALVGSIDSNFNC